MAASLFCPVCRVHLPAGGTHCARCGLRIAALPRRPKNRDLSDADVEALAAAEAASGAPLTLVQALIRGVLGGVVLVLLCSVIALVVTRGNALAAGMSNAAFFGGGIAVSVAVLIGGLRVRRLVGDIETMRQRALGGGQRLAHDHVRLAIGVAGVLALVVAGLLAAVAH